MAPCLSRGVTVHGAYFAVNLMIAFRFVENGIRVRLLYFAQPESNDQAAMKITSARDKHFSHLDLLRT